MSRLSDLVAEIERRTAVETSLGGISPEHRVQLASALADLEATASVARPAIRRRNELKRELAELEASLLPYDRARERLRAARRSAANDRESRADRFHRYRNGTDKLIDRLDKLDPGWRERVIQGGPLLRPDHETWEVTR